MNIMVFGASGFVGRAVSAVLDGPHSVTRVTRTAGDATGKTVQADLTDPRSVLRVLEAAWPDVVINCAGVIDQTQDVGLNTTFTRTILEQIAVTGRTPKRVIVSGSAGEYGVVNATDLPVNEDVPLRATAGYGLSKAQETTFALEYGLTHDIPVVIARIFNPVGPGMHSKFLVSNVLRQLAEFDAGQRDSLEVGRLDARRDYVDIRDVARAVRTLAEAGQTHERVYNVGSGIATTNRELIELLIDNSDVKKRPTLIETSPQPEPLMASQADIIRMRQEFGWSPTYPLEESIKEIIYATRS